MPLNVPLSTLRLELRAETGTSLNPAQGVQVQQTIDLLLARQQRELWDAYNWEHLQYWSDMPVAQGQALYSYPVEMPFEQIRRIFISMAPTGQWTPLRYGIKPWMIRPAGPNQGTPVRWRNVITVDTSGPTPVTNPIGQFEIIPTPSSGQMLLRLLGLAPLNALVADSDTCMIDSKAIVLFAAAEVLANQKSEGASIKLQKAQNYLRKLLADQGGDKRLNYNMAGSYKYGNDPSYSRYNRLVPYLDYIPS